MQQDLRMYTVGLVSYLKETLATVMLNNNEACDCNGA